MSTALDEKTARGEQLRRDGIVIRTYDLWKTYVMGDQEIHAVSGCEVEIRKGEYVAIMGPSGSGKSTLMNLIGCLDRPTGGSVTVSSVPVASTLPAERNVNGSVSGKPPSPVAVCAADSSATSANSAGVMQLAEAMTGFMVSMLHCENVP